MQPTSTTKFVNPATGRYFHHFRLPGDALGTMPPEIKEKISLKRLGQKHSVETCRKIAMSRMGKRHSSDTRSAISEGMKRAWEARAKKQSSSDGNGELF